MRGINVRVESTELAAHCSKRAAHHRERGAWFFSEAKRHDEEGKKWESMDLNRDEMAKSSYSNARSMGESCREKGKSHVGLANKFEFIASHLLPEDYELSIHECYELEFTSQR